MTHLSGKRFRCRIGFHRMEVLTRAYSGCRYCDALWLNVPGSRDYLPGRVRVRS